MNHTMLRFSLGIASTVSLGTFAAVGYPRFVAWNDTSNANLIASQRAATCLLADSVKPNLIPVGKDGLPLSPGTFVCSWDGATGQITGQRAIGYIRQGQPETIQKILESRGFKR